MNNINEYDNQVKLEKWYDGRKLRRYIQLLELSEQINPKEIPTENEQDKVFSSEVARLNSLFDPNFKV